MRIQSPSLSELHAFAEAARLGSYTLAAEQLSVTQGAISRAIARLEEHLGCPLFERQGRRNVLTAAGQQYLDAVAPALFTIESATTSLRRRPNGQQLCLSVPPTLFSQWLIPRLPDFSARHPGMVLRFAPYRRDDPLTSAQIDAWVRIGAAPWPEPLHADYLVGQDLVPICRPQDLEGEHGIRTPEDLRRRPLLAHTNYPDNWARWFQAMGDNRPCPAPAADFELVTQLVQGVMAGLGVAVVQRCLIAQDLATGRVVVPVQRPFRIERGYFLCWPAQRPAHPALEDFRRWVLEQAAADSLA
ncbi:LysR substrate-binding domain-containing protein [Comamonas sp. GB3 AK4-5]|uniref:LysR substrate-binding domain-containing protein n=1 Tax=Comamonas sp. GB3 AK4-5 TaxID=3231487 RepID=UPI00351F2A76